ncbi:HNH endonuclease [Escherichia coli]|nr:HNH endonuclease [Escherichia coli]
MISFVFLLPVCPNCHAMLHRRQPPFTPEELRKVRTSS